MRLTRFIPVTPILNAFCAKNVFAGSAYNVIPDLIANSHQETDIHCCRPNSNFRLHGTPVGTYVGWVHLRIGVDHYVCNLTML